MCDPVLIATILEELAYFDEKKEKDKKDKADDEKTNKDKLRNNGGRTRIAYKCQFACPAPSTYICSRLTLEIIRRYGGLNYETPSDKLQKVTELVS
jgi:hypothetical protein